MKLIVLLWQTQHWVFFEIYGIDTIISVYSKGTTTEVLDKTSALGL